MCDDCIDFSQDFVNLPKSEWIIKINEINNNMILASTRARYGYRYWDMYNINDLPNDIITDIDLKDLEIDLSNLNN